MDELIRIKAFEWLEKQSLQNEDVLSRDMLTSGFTYNNQQITLVGPKGIWKPQACKYPISITTTHDSPYDDLLGNDNFLHYKYRGTDPNHSDNVGLREAWRKQIPLIYFHGIDRGKYLPSWPVYIIGDDIKSLTFTVALDESKVISNNIIAEDPATYYRRSYLTSNIKIRLHQRSFRERVLKAYRNQCAFCRLKHIELLDAAHIIPDNNHRGEPIIQNGMALCKIHHAAYDKNILGVTPEFVIKVRNDVLKEIDGPMLKYGLQSLQNKIIELPKHPNDYPDRARLEERYFIFKSA